MTDKPTDEIERLAEFDAESACDRWHQICFDTDTEPDSTEHAALLLAEWQFNQTHSTAKEEVEGLKRQVENLEFALDQTHREKDALKKENEELKADLKVYDVECPLCQKTFWFDIRPESQKPKGLAFTVRAENPRPTRKELESEIQALKQKSKRAGDIATENCSLKLTIDDLKSTLEKVLNCPLEKKPCDLCRKEAEELLARRRKVGV